jgi:arylsulfatase A-like enzyme
VNCWKYSFYHVLRDPGNDHHEFITTTYKENQRAIRDEQYKLIRYRVNEEEHVQLFDLTEDPFETENLVGEDTYRAVLDRLNNSLFAQLKQFNDTIWVE